ncbi:tRNA (adenosine(37)-N6)-dimethylallyltransferase MiaA [Limnohabitans sp. Bal53]|uniref:tRNA (adenosine(37)-N6)-dimethylallyltransferase MiaA n=1 Tax=Limnohabitans sp. Bal53 TaxID=1977910 RepID=UPI000D3D62C5|nr:tRNA (adenosine(37)-N6)-dimethylallyltransferase MiaA [Limnohabitans sp. Bal53]PUE42535.1 tRNA (adenosine(37)-N6)-dimethylallyltransferase MiaA [Limnohabitans sp. Bal53]
MHTPLATQPSTQPDRPVDAIALVGPTASGKTAAALALAQSLEPQGGAEIISVDSALVYRGMDIGTAKPSREELAAVPHHLIDTLDPLHSYSAAQFAKEASRLIQDIRARGKTPLLVGGTMLYIKALLEGLNDIPTANPEIRARIHQQAEQLGWPALHAQLAQVDPQTAARLAPGDSQRIGRALEVWTATGQTLTSFHQSAKAQAPDWHIPIISLEPQDRAWLHQRIALRFEQMMAAGFMDEVQTLRARGDLNPDLPSMRCVGYRQAWEGLDGGWREAEILERGIFATRQLAKRQITWLRSMPDRVVVAADAPNAMEKVLSAAKANQR